MSRCLLFWCYKNPEVCANRLRLLRRHNAGVRIYGLYGGPPEEAGAFERALGPYLDDFYVHDRGRTPHWKWIYGDLMILDWYEDRGRHLAWDSLVVVQWDMLVTGPVEDLLHDVGPDEVLVSGYRPFGEVAPWWYWANGEHRPEVARFRDFLADRKGHGGELYACLFIVVVLPRAFVEFYLREFREEVGFLEYRFATAVHLSGVPVARTDRFLRCWKEEAGQEGNVHALLNARSEEVALARVLADRVAGRRLGFYHPFHAAYPLGLGSALRYAKYRLVHSRVYSALRGALRQRPSAP